MQIYGISGAYSGVRNYNPTSNVRNNYASKTSFQGTQTAKETQRVLKMLAEKNVEIIDNVEDVGIINNVVNNLRAKYAHWGIKGIGVQIISNEKDLAKMVGKERDLKDKVGVCVAIGDVFGPVEKWNKAYEARTILLPKALLKSFPKN